LLVQTYYIQRLTLTIVSPLAILGMGSLFFWMFVFDYSYFILLSSLSPLFRIYNQSYSNYVTTSVTKKLNLGRIAKELIYFGNLFVLIT